MVNAGSRDLISQQKHDIGEGLTDMGDLRIMDQSSRQDETRRHREQDKASWLAYGGLLDLSKGGTCPMQFFSSSVGHDFEE